MELRLRFLNNILHERKSSIEKDKYEQSFKYNLMNILRKGEHTINIVLFFQKYAKDLLAMEEMNLPGQYNHTKKILEDIVDSG